MLKRTVGITICFFGVQLASTELSLETSANEITLEEIQKFAQSPIDAGRIDGLSVGVIKGDQRYTVHLGKTGDGQSKPTDQSIYEIGSISKVFTGLLLASAALKEEGLLEQTAFVKDVQTLPERNGKQIRWIDLSTHRSGLPRLADNMPDVGGSDPYATYDSKLASEFLAGHELRRDPGEAYEYSNFAVSWLGYLLQTKAGTTYESLLRETITQPLGMEDTGIRLSDPQRLRFATPHQTVGTPTNPWQFADLPGAGAIRSSLSDMMKFAEACLHPGDHSIGQIIEFAFRKHAPPNRSGNAMGLGWLFARDGETRFHNGQTGGFSCAIFVSRRFDTAVVVLANTAASDVTDGLAERLIQRMAGMNVKPQTFSNQIDVDIDFMKRLVGRYKLTDQFIFDVKLVDGKLMVGVTNQPTFQVFAKSKTVWFYKVVSAELTFQLDESGSAKSVELFQNGVRQTAIRIQE